MKKVRSVHEIVTLPEEFAGSVVRFDRDEAAEFEGGDKLFIAEVADDIAEFLVSIRSHAMEYAVVIEDRIESVVEEVTQLVEDLKAAGGEVVEEVKDGIEGAKDALETAVVAGVGVVAEVNLALVEGAETVKAVVEGAIEGGKSAAKRGRRKAEDAAPVAPSAPESTQQ